MKKNYTLFVLSFVLLLASSCQTTSIFKINVTDPAPVFLDSTFKKAGVINRSAPSQKNKTLDALDKIFSAEGKDLDKDGARSAILGTRDELKQNPRFNKVVLIDSTGLTTPGLGIFPASIPWDVIDKISKENDIDVLFVLSFYDTDAKVDYSNRPVELRNPLGIKVKAIEHKASIDTRIKTGWRIYDTKNKTIRDEIILNERTISSGTGINPVKAAEAIANRKENVLEISNYLGQENAQRVIAQERVVNRAIYVRGSDNLKAAKRYINTDDWQSAESLWTEDAMSTKRKVAGRATYNLAVVSEINGDLNQAIEWANKSYLEFNNKKALAYLNTLKNRIAKNNELEEQRNN